MSVLRDLDAREIDLLRYVAEAPRTQAEMRAYIGCSARGGDGILSSGPCARLLRRLLIAEAGRRRRTHGGHPILYAITERGHDELGNRRRDRAGRFLATKPPVTTPAQSARMTCASPIPCDWASVLIPLRTVSGANAREHWRTKAARVKRERMVVAWFLRAHDASLRWAREPGLLVVTLTRIAPRTLDTDNLASALKAVRDEAATYLGVTDAPGAPVTWRCEQERGEPRQYAVRVRIERAGGEA